MVYDFTRESVLSGMWEGYYDHDDKQYSSKNFPISAMIEQDGQSFRGIMHDGVTEFRQFYRTIVEAYEGRMSPIAEWFARRTLKRSPDYTIEASLPEDSRLVGEILGDKIRFTKTYLGPHIQYGNSGSRKEMLLRVNHHRVIYQGTLIAEDGVIEGKWSITGGGFLGLFRRTINSGGFQLFKQK